MLDGGSYVLTYFHHVRNSGCYFEEGQLLRRVCEVITVYEQQKIIIKNINLRFQGYDETCKQRIVELRRHTP
jgi:hypothetical protein